MKIIVADDSLVMRKILTGVIESMGCESLPAANGQEVLDLLEKSEIDTDLILMDWNMPIMNGIETLTAMRNDSRLKTIPVLMVSTECEEESISQAIQAGAKGYITKPFTKEDLAAKIKEILS